MLAMLGSAGSFKSDILSKDALFTDDTYACGAPADAASVNLVIDLLGKHCDERSGALVTCTLLNVLESLLKTNAQSTSEPLMKKLASPLPSS